MHERLARRAAEHDFALDLRAQGAERLPFADASVDAVISTLVLCSVEDVAAVLGEVKRVLRPGGTFRCIEHVAAPVSDELFDRRCEELGVLVREHVLAAGRLDVAHVAQPLDRKESTESRWRRQSLCDVRLAARATSRHARMNKDLRTLLSLAWPIVLARATQAVIGFCDALMVAPLGEEALAAATTGALNTLAAIILPMGTVFIVQSFASQLRGRGDAEALPRYAWYGLALAVGAAVLALAVTPAVPWLLGRFRYAPAVHEQMSSYVAIRLLSVGAVVGTEALGNWYGGIGNTRLAMVAGVVAMVANVIGCYVLIEPRFGLPGLGVAGSAWAAVIASWLGFAVVLFAFLRGLGLEQRPRIEGLSARELGRVLRFGLPNGVNWFLEFAAFTLFINVVVAHLGTTVLAAMNVVMQINTVAFMPAFGVASSGAVLVGQAIGKGDKDRVWPIVKLTGIVTSVWMVSVGLLYLVAPAQLMGLFKPRDVPADALIATGATMLALGAIWQLFDALSMTLSETLRAAGDTTWCMVARIVLAWVVFTPLAWSAVFVFHGGVVTVMISLIVYIAVLALALALRFASNRWRSIELVEADLST